MEMRVSLFVMTTRSLENYLRMYRKRSGLTQKELAVLLGCSDGSKVSRYERGVRLPSLDTLIAYSIIFTVSPEDLFVGKYDLLLVDVRQRAQKLHKQLDGCTPFNAGVKRKMEFLVEIIYPPKDSGK